MYYSVCRFNPVYYFIFFVFHIDNIRLMYVLYSENQTRRRFFFSHRVSAYVSFVCPIRNPFFHSVVFPTFIISEPLVHILWISYSFRGFLILSHFSKRQIFLIWFLMSAYGCIFNRFDIYFNVFFWNFICFFVSQVQCCQKF